MKNSNVKKLVEISLLIALEVILTRFCSIYTGVLRIGFGFLPVAIIAMMYGPISAGVAYAIGDILRMMIFPSGSYFPGFTLTAFLTGVIYGVVLCKHPKTWGIGSTAAGECPPETWYTRPRHWRGPT